LDLPAFFLKLFARAASSFSGTTRLFCTSERNHKLVKLTTFFLKSDRIFNMK
jgi:hypothetical protein